MTLHEMLKTTSSVVNTEHQDELLHYFLYTLEDKGKFVRSGYQWHGDVISDRSIKNANYILCGSTEPIKTENLRDLSGIKQKFQIRWFKSLEEVKDHLEFYMNGGFRYIHLFPISSSLGNVFGT